MLDIENAGSEQLLEAMQPSGEGSMYSAQSLKFAFFTSFFYLLLSYLLIGFKTDQLVLTGLFNGCYFASKQSRKFILGFSIFIVYWIIFDYMKAFPNFRFNTVATGELYGLEKRLFGFNWNGAVLTPNEFFIRNHTPLLDVFSGIAYLCWVPVPLAFAAWLFFRNRKYFFYFSLSFFLVNLIGFAGYYIYPAAPPWYISQYGFDFHSHISGNTAGLARFDALMGVSIFDSLYSKSSNVFAAMPSLHASYMLIVLYYAIKVKLKWYYILLFTALLLGIWFSAVYNNHHYVLDILAGILCGITGIALFQWFIRKKQGKFLIYNLVSATS